MRKILALAVLLPSLAFSQGVQRGPMPAFDKVRPAIDRGLRCTQYAETTNYALQSKTISTGTAYTSPWAANNSTVTTDGDWAVVTNVGFPNTGGPYQTSATFPAMSVFTVSLRMAKPTGTGYAVLFTRCANANNATACSCTRSDGGACAATVGSPSAVYCKAEVADLGTTPIRLSVTHTCTSAHTAAQIQLSPGRYGTATGTTRFTEVQLEPGATATPHIATTTAAVTRAAGCY